MLAAAVAVLLPLSAAAVSAGAAPTPIKSTSTTDLVGVTEARALFRGIPQDGMTLGRKSAPATLWQAEDPQCPVCKEYSETTLPRIIKRDVRTGRARVRLVMFPFIGSDSDRGAQFVIAAGRQDRAFQALELIFRNQGSENSGYMTDAYLRRIASAVGLDVPRVMAAMASPAVATAVRRQTRFAQIHGSTGTPTLWTQRGGQRLRQARDFTDAAAISQQLAQP